MPSPIIADSDMQLRFYSSASIAAPNVMRSPFIPAQNSYCPLS
jgi:hypothetical protein